MRDLSGNEIATEIATAGADAAAAEAAAAADFDALAPLLPDGAGAAAKSPAAMAPAAASAPPAAASDCTRAPPLLTAPTAVPTARSRRDERTTGMVAAERGGAYFADFATGEPFADHATALLSSCHSGGARGGAATRRLVLEHAAPRKGPEGALVPRTLQLIAAESRLRECARLGAALAAAAAGAPLRLTVNSASVGLESVLGACLKRYFLGAPRD